MTEGGLPAWPDTAAPLNRDRSPPLAPACAGAAFGISPRRAGGEGIRWTSPPARPSDELQCQLAALPQALSAAAALNASWLTLGPERDARSGRAMLRLG